LRQRIIGEVPLHLNQVFLFMVKRGMRQPVMNFAVICQKQQSCGILVQSPHRKNALVYIHQVEHDRRPFCLQLLI
jgi:hypothetical protein